MTRVSPLLSSACALLCFVCIHSLPVLEERNTNRYKSSAGWLEKSPLNALKKRGRLHHTESTPNWVSSVKGLPAGTALPRSDADSRRRPHCGVPDIPTHGKTDRQRRFVLYGERWEKTDLTYKIKSFPRQIGKERVRQILQEALQVWSDVTPLTFTEVSGGKADITIDFARYWHGDFLPFDGQGGILAHAFFPKTPHAGDIHFDLDEVWTLGNDMGTDLLQVAAHEFGHMLGLQHSLVPGAVMSPFYSFSYPLALNEDDKQGVQYLYGKRVPVSNVHKTNDETNEIVTSTPDACHTDFDAVSMIRGELFFFKSSYVWRVRDGQLQKGYPALASRHWRGIPENIDAVFEDRSGNIWFFQGHSYWVYDAERQIKGPESVGSLGLPVSHIQAALVWGEVKTPKVGLFKTGSYWYLDPLESRVDDAQARSVQDWRGVPAHIDAAFQDYYGYAVFLSGRQYWKVDPVEMKILEGYPRNVGTDFFGCRVS